MLRLLIADDERVIREMIHDLIDWNSLGIEVVGLCKNGIEAYDMVLDEYPDIVLTDIKMPGLSGLELIQKVSELNQNIQFIILSGYGEFEYAKEAMQYGVRHYLLKPCNEYQIIDIMKQVTADCQRRRAFLEIQEKNLLFANTLYQTILRSIITESLSNELPPETLLSQYEHFLDFQHTDYILHYLYYLPENCLTAALEEIHANWESALSSPETRSFILYVKNTLVLFYPNTDGNVDNFSLFLSQMHFPACRTDFQTEYKLYPNLSALLQTLLTKLRRFEVVYLMDGLHKIKTVNHNALLHFAYNTAKALSEDNDDGSMQILQTFQEQLSEMSDTDLMKTIINSLILKYADNSSYYKKYNPDISEFLVHLGGLETADSIRSYFMEHSPYLFQTNQNAGVYKDFIEKTLAYVNEHLADSSLSLKWIAENYLFMNVDYVSKQFVRQTGIKFSAYLTNTRMELAKKILLKQGSDKICNIAEEIGYGNNPQYFSQLFKKYTGMSPTVWVKNTLES